MMMLKATLLAAWVMTNEVSGQGGQKITFGEHSKCKTDKKKMGCHEGCPSGWNQYKTSGHGCCRDWKCFGEHKHCQRKSCKEENRGKIWTITVPASGSYSIAKLYGDINDDISSISWDGRCQVSLYQHPDFKGDVWKFGWGKNDSGWEDKASSVKVACRNDCKWKSWSGWSKCSHTCGSKGTQYRRRSSYPATHGGKRCSGADRETRSCNRKLCPITKIECSDFEIPNEAELPQFCTDVFVDVITVDKMSTGATKGMVTYKRGTEEQMTRSTTSGFSSEFGWDFSAADKEWSSVTDSTEILIKDPSVSIGFEAAGKEISASHSCFNKNSVQCTARGALGVGSKSVGAFFTSGGANILGGLMDKMAKLGSSGKEDPDKCKCKETKTTVSKDKGEEHTTTVGVMRKQGRTMEQTFESSKMKHTSQEYTLECPPWNECAYATYSVTSICAIPYWGTCKATRSDGRVDTFTIERDDTKNLYYTKQTQPRTESFSGVTEMTTDGSICGVMLTPAIHIPDDRHVATCPPPNEISTLPNCDCMLPEYNDCGTPDGTLKNGQWCLLNVREGVTDNEICVRSKPHWRNISSCYSRDVFVVSDYNSQVYQRLKAAIQLGDARPKYFKYTLRGDTGTEVVKVNGVAYVLGKSERAFQNEGPTVEIEFTNDGQTRDGENRNVFLARTEGSFTLVPYGGSVLRGYNGWNCGTENENFRCRALRSGGMHWNGFYEATLADGASQPGLQDKCTLGCEKCGYNWYEVNWNNGQPTHYFKNRECKCCAIGGNTKAFDDCGYYCTRRKPPTQKCPEKFVTSGECPEVGMMCEYGKECCCGKCHPSQVSECFEDGWAGRFTDACLGGCVGPDRDGSSTLA